MIVTGLDATGLSTMISNVAELTRPVTIEAEDGSKETVKVANVTIFRHDDKKFQLTLHPDSNKTVVQIIGAIAVYFGKIKGAKIEP